MLLVSGSISPNRGIFFSSKKKKEKKKGLLFDRTTQKHFFGLNFRPLFHLPVNPSRSTLVPTELHLEPQTAFFVVT